MNTEALAINASNEGGVYGSNRFLKNVMGLWIVQQCRNADEESVSYQELMKKSRNGSVATILYFSRRQSFLLPGNHPEIIQQFCRETGQSGCRKQGVKSSGVYWKALALRYREVIESLSACASQVRGKRSISLAVDRRISCSTR